MCPTVHISCEPMGGWGSRKRQRVRKNDTSAEVPSQDDGGQRKIRAKMTAEARGGMTKMTVVTRRPEEDNGGRRGRQRKMRGGTADGPSETTDKSSHESAHLGPDLHSGSGSKSFVYTHVMSWYKQKNPILFCQKADYHFATRCDPGLSHERGAFRR